MGAICFGAKRGHNFSSSVVPLSLFWHHFMHRMNIEQRAEAHHQPTLFLSRLETFLPLLRELMDSVCPVRKMGWNQIGLVLRPLFGSFAYLISLRTIGPKSVKNKRR